VQITVTGRHVEVSPEMKTFIEDKVSRLPRYYDRVSTIDVVIGHESEQLTAEMIVKADHAPPFIAREVGADAHALIDLLMDKMERQLTKHKERNRDHHAG
jgi:putative sigma-54 modulation protein